MKMNAQQKKTESAPRFQRLKTFGKALFVVGGLAASTMTGRAQNADTTLATTNALLFNVGGAHNTTIGANGSENGAMASFGAGWRQRTADGKLAYGAHLGGEMYSPENNTVPGNSKDERSAGGRVGGFLNFNNDFTTSNAGLDLGIAALPKNRGSRAFGLKAKLYSLFKTSGKTDGPFADLAVDHVSGEMGRTNYHAYAGFARQFIKTLQGLAFVGSRKSMGGFAASNSQSGQFSTEGVVAGAGISYEGMIAGGKVLLTTTVGTNAITQPDQNRVIFGDAKVQTPMFDFHIGVDYGLGRTHKYTLSNGASALPSTVQIDGGVSYKFNF